MGLRVARATSVSAFNKMRNILILISSKNRVAFDLIVGTKPNNGYKNKKQVEGTLKVGLHLHVYLKGKLKLVVNVFCLLEK
jgi:hypothetical protein